jgi:predicted metalloprotease
MATSYLTPGVYVEEVPSANKPIEGVGTAVAAFVGLAPGGPVNKPMRISNWTQFAKLFGDAQNPDNGPFMEGAYLAHAVYGFFQNGGSLCWIVRVGEDSNAPPARASLPAANDKGVEALRAVALEGVTDTVKIDVSLDPKVRDGDGEGGGGGGGGGGGYGGGGGFGVGRGGLGIGTIVVLGIVGWALGIDPRLLIGGAEILSGGGSQYEEPMRPTQSRNAGAPTDEAGQFVAAVLGSTEDVWQAVFKQNGQTYKAPKLILYARQTGAGRCGNAQAQMGPFYCPPEHVVFLDTAFFKEIEQRFRGCTGKACKFSQAYVIAHEVGHHVQNELGLLDDAQRRQQAAGGRAQANRIQVGIELQADCFAGIWANIANKKYNFIDPGDVDAALQTASAIGDDTLQRKAEGRVVPDSFTHGSAEQRKRWFMTGFQQGNVAACNTRAAGDRL